MGGLVARFRGQVARLVLLLDSWTVGSALWLRFTAFLHGQTTASLTPDEHSLSTSLTPSLTISLFLFKIVALKTCIHDGEFQGWEIHIYRRVREIE